MTPATHDQAAGPPGSDARRIADEQSVVAAINEEVSLRPHDPAWGQLFEIERSRLQSLLPGRFLAIEHMGSTAVAGLVAKPIIDILAAVRSLEGVDALIEQLSDNGYTTSREFNATLNDRKWLMRSRNGHRTHHLHIVALESAPWADRLAFRDALRRDPGLARRYAELKTALAAQHRADREAYTEAKAQFVRDAVSGLGQP